MLISWFHVVEDHVVEDRQWRPGLLLPSLTAGEHPGELFL